MEYDSRVVYMSNMTGLLLIAGAVLLASKGSMVTSSQAAQDVVNMGSGNITDAQIPYIQDLNNYVQQQQSSGVDNATIINNLTSQIGPQGSNGSWINGVFVPTPSTPQQIVATIPELTAISGAPLQVTSGSMNNLISFIHNNPGWNGNYTIRDQYGADRTYPLSELQAYLGL